MIPYTRTVGAHPESCRDPDCTLPYAEHLRSIHISAHATPSRHQEAVNIDRTEAQWGQDMPAYKRLRANGLQPKNIDGCAELEKRATDRFEVEMGHLFSEKEKPAIREGMQVAKEMAG